jgi:tRNA G18 (ribose-2'-O)-methylase SpoU
MFNRQSTITTSTMHLIRIDNRLDSRISDYHSISDAELIRSRGLFVAEGRRVVQRLVDGRRFPVRSVLLNEAALRALGPTLALLDANVPVYVCAAEHVLQITGHAIHRGCLALAERPQALPVENVLRNARLVVVLEGVANPDNVGGVFRNAAAFGVDAVLLSPECCDPLYRKSIRTSMGASLQVPFARVWEWPFGLSELRGHHFTLIALTPREPSIPLHDYAALDPPERLAFMVGAEGDGLSAAAEQAADVHVRIPIKPEVDSLNLAVATGIALSRLTTHVGPEREQDAVAEP